MRQTETQKNWNNYYGYDKPRKSNRVNIIIFIVAFLLFFPFDIKTINVLGSETTLYKATLYSVIRTEAVGLVKTKFCFFPSNLDANNNFDTLSNAFDSLNDNLNDLFNLK